MDRDEEHARTLALLRAATELIVRQGVNTRRLLLLNYASLTCAIVATLLLLAIEWLRL
jgi:hypothetical protein